MFALTFAIKKFFQRVVPAADVFVCQKLRVLQTLVFTTAQLSEFYECSARNISDNFKRNENRFVVGKHFFCLEGDDLRKFRELSAKS